MQPAAAPDSDYYTRMGLDCDPFAAEALPEFFFVGAQRRFLVQRAVHALYFSGATVLLIGDDGIGKTRTLVEIEKELKDLADICRIEATVLMSATEIRAQLAIALGLPATVAVGNAELVHALERVSPADGDPQPVLIAIDAAQLLSIEALAECAALVAGAGGRLRLLLAGEADLAIAWQQAQAGAAEALELAPLDRDETADYVRTKLQAAGYREEQPLGDAEFDQLFAQSGGNFAAINALAPQLLQPLPESASSVVRRMKALPMLHIGLIAALLTVVILLVLYRGGDAPSLQETQSTESAAGQAQPAPTATKADEQRTVALQLPESESTAESTTLPAPVAAVATPAEIPAPIQTENKSQTAEKKSKASATNAPSSSFSTDESALLALPSSNYVLQLMGAESKITVDKFAKGAGKGLRLYCYRTQLRGKPWFIVVTGPYADKKAAQAALAKLPEAVRKQQPWPRTLVNVQADIRAHRGR